MKMMKPNSAEEWNIEEQSRFWNEWDARHLSDATIGEEALRRGELVLTLLRSCSLQRPQILELGCGNGWLAQKLAAFGPVTGIDLAERAILEARQRVPSGAFYAGDALNVKLPTESFDVVVTLEMFSHVASQIRFVEVMAKVLRKGGFLILMTQNRLVYMRRADITPVASGQIRRWVTRRELRRMLHAHFQILNESTLQPSGTLGFLRYVNSNHLNRLASRVISQQQIERLKERFGLGQTIVVLAKKDD